jgi:nickel-dependent lactate racemase
MNHKFALSDNARSLCLKGNPIHEDFTDSLKFLKDINIFSIQTVLTKNYEIYAAKCGDIIKSFDEITEFANNIYCVPIREKGNIVVASVPYPMDINLYQSQHALENGKLALEDDGVMILVSKCRMGVGNDAFVEILSKVNSPQEVLDLHGGEYKLGSHKSYRILKIKSKAHIFAVTGLDDETVEKSKMKPYSDIQSAIDDAVKIVKEPRIIVIPSGNLTVPFIK